MIDRVTRLARKLRGRDFAEFRERGGQALAAWRERAGYAWRELALDDAALSRRLRPGIPADPVTLLDRFRAREPRFMPVFDDPASTLGALAAACPDDRADVMARAERVLGGSFDVLAYTGLSYGRPVDWHLDPVRDRRAPEVHWSRVPYLDAGVVGDHKVTWEVNRQQYLVTLGQAYWYTRDERWARAALQYVTDWLDANPPKRGINWASSLEVAFRAMSWVWALHLLRGSDALTPGVYGRVLSALHVHARHLERYLSTYFSPNTHLTGEALGLVHVGALFPELAASERWLRLGLDVFRTWLPRQVRADGGYFEQATQYHRYTTEFVLHLLILDERRGWGLAAWLRPLLERLAGYLQSVARPDGTIPLIGDDDGGKLVLLDGHPPDDVRGVLAQLAARLGSPTLAHTARGSAEASQASLPSVLWLLGAEGGRRFEALVPRAPAPRSAAFRETGVFVIRDGWDTRSTHAVVDCGPHGAFNAGHAHADLLSLTLSAGGRPLLVDSGTYTYPGPERNEFRGAGAHNALLVDGRGSSEPAADAFQWRTTADGRLLDWVARDDVTLFEGQHNGFARLEGVGAHRRAVLFLPGVGLIVRDRLEAAGTHEVRVHWHAAPGLSVLPSVDAPRAVLVDEAGRALVSLVTFGAGALAVEPAWVSPRYGARVPAMRLAYTQRASGPQDVTTFLLLAGGTSDRPPAVESVSVRGFTQAFVVSGGHRAGGTALLVGLDPAEDWRAGVAAAFDAPALETVVSLGAFRVVSIEPRRA